MRLRLISAAVLIPAVLIATWAGEIPFLIVVLVTGALVLHEWLSMVGLHRGWTCRLVGWCALALIALAAQTQTMGVAALAVGFAVLASVVVVWRDRPAASARWVAAGTLYAGLAVVALIALRKGSDGFSAIVFVFLIAWATDTFAFFVGRQVGGPKLWPQVSPSKTWSGAVGGLVAGVIFGAIAAWVLNVEPAMKTLLAAGAVAIAAQAGDLLESAAKRRFSVKDAGSLIPGHGGVMDRVDGVVLAALVTAGLGIAMAGETVAGGFLTLMAAP
ncbi:MAG: phosphatidate cytidylyltransferase [Pseudomonadota bacterium]